MTLKTAATDQDIKNVVKAIADSELLVSELTGGFSFSEIGQFVAVAGDLPAVLQDGSILFPEWASLSSDQQADLVAYIQANCKYPANVVIEAYAQKVLQAAVLVSSLYQVFAPAPAQAAAPEAAPEQVAPEAPIA